jgi:hypothetical protein
MEDPDLRSMIYKNRGRSYLRLTPQARRDALLIRRVSYLSLEEAANEGLALLARPLPPEARWQAEALGLRPGNAGSVRAALEAWAHCVRHAARANARPNFLTPAAWCAVAEACRSVAEAEPPAALPPASRPGRFLAECLVWGDRLFGLGAKWFGPNSGPALRRALTTLRSASYPRGAAALAAVRWYWRHAHEVGDPLASPWWDPQWQGAFEAARAQADTASAKEG